MYEGLIPHFQLQEFFKRSNYRWFLYPKVYKYESCLISGTKISVRVEVVFQYLHILKHINPLYSNIEIDDSPAVVAFLESLTSELLNINNVTIMDEEVDLTNEEAATVQV